MNIQKNLVVVNGQQFIATSDCLKNSKTVVKKIKFNDSETEILSACDFDFEQFKKAKSEYGTEQSEQNLKQVSELSPMFLYLKQRKADSESVAVAVAFGGQVYLNKNVDSELGVGAEATRYKYMAYINGFIQLFTKNNSPVEYFEGMPFVCESSAFDDRKTGGQKTDDSCLEW